MAAQILMTLGGFQFEINTAAHEQMQRQNAYRWEKQDRLGREPAMQFIGKGEEKISLNGTIYPHFRGGLGQINSMRRMAEDGEPLQLIDGLGNVFGRYCILQVQETQTTFLGPGIPRRMDFSLELSRYGEDQFNGGGSGGGWGGWFGSLFGVIA